MCCRRHQGHPILYFAGLTIENQMTLWMVPSFHLLLYGVILYS